MYLTFACSTRRDLAAKKDTERFIVPGFQGLWILVLLASVALGVAVGFS